MRYRTIYADPPWKLSGGRNGRGGWSKSASPDAHYGLMTTDEIAFLPVQDLAEADAHLYLWTVNGLLPDGIAVMRTWGFRYVNNLCWFKTTGYGLGQYFRGQHELCLFGIRGHPGYRDTNGKRNQARSLVMAPRGKHSEKPEEIRKIIEHVSPGPYLELFARTRAPGWHAWGNEIESDIEFGEFGHATHDLHGGVREERGRSDNGSTSPSHGDSEGSIPSDSTKFGMFDDTDAPIDGDDMPWTRSMFGYKPT